MNAGWLWLILLIGAPIGSFMAAFAGRICAGVSLWRPSTCDTCKSRIAPRDLIPIFSYILLRGRCRNCGTKLPFRLFLAELGGFGAAMLAVASSQTLPELLFLAVILWCLLGLALTDLTCFRLPDALTAPLFVAAIGLAWTDPAHSAVNAALSGLLGAMVLFIIRWGYQRLRGQEGLGLGDVKLCAGIGALVGALALPWVGLIAAGTALAAVSLGLFGPADRKTALPFGAFLCLGTVTVMIAQRV